MSIDWEIYVSRYQQYLQAWNSFLQFYLASLKTIVRSSIVHIHIYLSFVETFIRHNKETVLNQWSFVTF